MYDRVLYISSPEISKKTDLLGQQLQTYWRKMDKH